MMTRDQYIKEAIEELGEREYKFLSASIDNEYYEMVETEAKQGNVISKEVYNSLTEGQRYHFNKHYNHRNDLIAV
jgi:hypothetical protein